MKFKALFFTLMIASSFTQQIASAQNTNTEFAEEVVNNNITIYEVKKAASAWGAALTAISAEFDKGGLNAARTLAEKAVNPPYDYTS